MVRSVAGALGDGTIDPARPFRDPHHSSSMPALIGGGSQAKPGEVSLAHCGVLFLDELAEFPRPVLDSLRQPIETGRAVISRANRHVTYPTRFQLVAAMNPCRCGYLADPARACAQTPRCAESYQARLSGPLLDRFDPAIEVAAVAIDDLSALPTLEGSATIAARGDGLLNARVDGAALTAVCALDRDGDTLLRAAAEALQLSARGYHRVLRVARTIADLEAGGDTAETPVARRHLAEALSYRRAVP